ncbi:MAG: ABC transporter permease [Nevskiaceae bacterium]|jgi:ABC-2 type transport system permease protein|nr:ABC transporter permease [Nevskiaceae bacterium]
MTSNMPAIFMQELRILLRDRRALGLLLAMPLTLIIFLTLALQDIYTAKAGRSIDVALVSRSNCDAPDTICRQFMTELRHYHPDMPLLEPADAANVTHEILLELPPDMAATLEKLRSGAALVADEQIRLTFDPLLDQSVRAVVEGHVALSLQAVLINRATAELENAEAAFLSDIIPKAGNFDGLIHEQAIGGVKLPTPAQQTVPAWILFGMFFIVIPLSGSMIRDRRLGIFRRLLVFPVFRAELLLGKVLPFYVINLLQFGTMFAVGMVLLPLLTHIPQPLDFSILDLVFVTMVASMAATGYGLMVSCLARTEEQASAFGALSVVILAVIGGVMIPRFAMPDFMQNIAMISPFHWGLEAYQDVILRNAPLTVILPKLGVLLIFAAACTAIAALRFRWSEA